MKGLQQWWQSLVSRERIVVAILGVFVFLMMFQMLVWNPLYQGRQNAAYSVNKQAELLHWMQQNAQRATQLQSNTITSSSSVKGQSISQTINVTAAFAKIDINRFQTAGEHSVQVWLDNADFSTLLLWLETIQKQHGIQTDSIAISETSTAGLVSVRMTLTSD